MYEDDWRLHSGDRRSEEDSQREGSDSGFCAFAASFTTEPSQDSHLSVSSQQPAPFKRITCAVITTLSSHSQAKRRQPASLVSTCRSHLDVL